MYLPGIGNLPNQKLEAFFMDKYEVTNKEYKAFIDHGGYQNKNYWDFEFEKNGRVLGFEEAMKLLIDVTGKPGPAGWELSDYPDGMGDYPVTGVSWYEAAAYAQYAQKQLPTIYHWNRAASPWYGQGFVPFSNFKNNGLALAGQFKGVSSNGVYDICGNAREWILNSSNQDNGKIMLGGAWSDSPDYAFDVGILDPWDRSLVNGFRCIKYDGKNDNQDILEGRIVLVQHDYSTTKVATDEEFELIARQYEYDEAPLDARVTKVESAIGDWTVEEISFDAAYENETMTAYLYLPVDHKAPFQTVVYFMGSAGLFRDVFDPETDANIRWFDFIIKSGRAVLFPILQSTYQRDDETNTDAPNTSNYYKERFIMRGKDIKRSIDYLETRDDIDAENIAFYGFSWGAAVGGAIGAIEPRIKCLILSSGGLFSEECQKEVDVLHYLPRVKQPVLMLNGRYDVIFSNASQFSMFKLLGTDEEHKKHIILEGNHILPRGFLIVETLKWLDTYLGPVE